MRLLAAPWTIALGIVARGIGTGCDEDSQVATDGGAAIDASGALPDGTAAVR